MGLLERDGLLSALDAALAAAASGHGSLCVVAGEAGVGKTALVDAFCRRHQARVSVLSGGCDTMRTAAVLGPVHDIAALHPGRLAELLATCAPRHEVFTAFLGLLSPPRGARIVVIEDVHWADEATLDLLVFLARRAGSTRSVVVATLRDDNRQRDAAWRFVASALATAPSVHRLQVPALSRDAVAELAHAGGVDAEYVYEVTGGNPFFVTALLDNPGAGLPATVRDVVLDRVASHSPAARSVLEVTAAAPQPIPIAMLRDILGDDDAAIDECQQLGLLQRDGARLRYRHELARIAVEESTPPIRRAAAHRRILARLVTQPGVDPARLAYHAEQAGDGMTVLRQAPVAAQHAAKLGAHREAAAQYARALAFSDLMTPGEQAELLESYASECRVTNRVDDALDASTRALAIWHTLGEAERHAELSARHALTLCAAGRGADARRATDEAVTLLRTRGTAAQLATAVSHQAAVRMLARDIAGALSAGREAIALSAREDLPALLTLALNAVGSAQWFTDPDAAVVTLSRSLDHARARGDDAATAMALVNLGSGAGEVRRYATADRWLRETITWCTERDQDTVGGYATAWLARIEFEQGRWEQARALAGAVADPATTYVPTRIVALTVLGRLRTRRGDPHAGEPLDQAWALAAETEDLQRLWPVAAARAEAAWLAGQPEAITGLTAVIYRMAVELGHGWAVGELGSWLWLAGHLAEPPRDAAVPYALQIAGEWAAASRAWHELGCPYESAVALTMTSAAGDLSAGYDRLEALGAWPAVQRLAQSLRQAGIRKVPRRPRRVGADNPAGLTDREVEVLDLLAEDLRNAEIAARLHISRRTVEHHVAAIIGKLGVSTRHEAARLARRA